MGRHLGFGTEEDPLLQHWFGGRGEGSTGPTQNSHLPGPGWGSLFRSSEHLSWTTLNKVAPPLLLPAPRFPLALLPGLQTWALEPDCLGQSLLFMDCGLLEDGVFGLLTAISQPQALSPCYRWGNQGPERTTGLSGDHTADDGSKRTFKSCSLWSAPTSLSPVAGSQTAPLPPSPSSRQYPITQVSTAFRKGWSSGGKL